MIFVANFISLNVEISMKFYGEKKLFLQMFVNFISLQ